MNAIIPIPTFAPDWGAPLGSGELVIDVSSRICEMTHGGDQDTASRWLTDLNSYVGHGRRAPAGEGMYE